MKKTIAVIVVLVMAFSLFAGCGGGGGTEKKDLHILSWGDYIDMDLIQEFKDANPDLNVVYTTTTSNEEMYAIAATTDCQIDIMIPSDYMIEKMTKNDLLAEINVNNIENFKYVADYAKTCTFDPDSKYSVPYTYGTLGILYNTKLVDDVVDSWDILWNEKYSKKIAMYDSVRDSMAVALIKLGYSINSKNPEELKAAGEELIKQKPLVYTYGTDNLKDEMVAGGCAMAVMYSGDAIFAMQDNEDLAYAVPKEGSNIWADNFVVLKNSDNMEGAERFINFMLDPENSAKNTDYLCYSNPSPEALKLLTETDLLENEAFIVTEDQRNRCEYFTDVEDALEYYNDEWMRLKNTTV